MSSFKLSSPAQFPVRVLLAQCATQLDLSSSVTAVSAAPGRHNSLLLAKIVVVFLQLLLFPLPPPPSASYLLSPVVVVVVHFHEQFVCALYATYAASSLVVTPLVSPSVASPFPLCLSPDDCH